MRNESFDSAREESSRSVVKGALAGMAGGLVASWVMDRLEQVMKTTGADAAVEAGPGRDFAPPITEEQLAQTTYSSSAPQMGTPSNGIETPNGIDRKKSEPTVHMANRIAKTFLHHEVPEEKQDLAGKAVHYAFGTLVGGLYGAVAEMSPEVVSRFGGLPFGMAVWLLADELALPAFQLGKKPGEKPIQQHASGLATHFVYGAATDGVRRLLRSTAIH